LARSGLLAILIFWFEPLNSSKIVSLLLGLVPRVFILYVGEWTPAKLTGFHDEPADEEDIKSLVMKTKKLKSKQTSSDTSKEKNAWTIQDKDGKDIQL
jgi:hypothetical protein